MGSPALSRPRLTGAQHTSSPEASQSFTSSAPTLSFVQVVMPGSEEMALSRKVVRSHVMREHHRNRRMASIIQHRKTQDLASKNSATSLPKTDNASRDPSQNGTITNQRNWVQPSHALPYLDNCRSLMTPFSCHLYLTISTVIPYSYFAPDGPVLYIKPSNWPFPRPFAMAGADRTERFGNSDFPRQSIWMPNAVIATGVVIKGPLLGGDVLSWISHSPECFKYRVDLIKWIQDRLNSPETATDDAVIGAIMTLTMWEVISSLFHNEPIADIAEWPL